MPLTQVQGQMLNGSNNTTTTIQSNGTTAITIDSSQNVGIGGTPVSVASTKTLTIYDATEARIQLQNSTSGTTSTDGSSIAINGADLYINNRENGNQLFFVNGSERMRITAGGNLLVGTTSADAKFVTTDGANVPIGRFYATLSTYTSEAFQVICAKSSNTNFNVAAFYINNAAQYAAYIRGDGTIFAQSTTIQSASDVRFKENIVDSTDGLNIVNQLRPVRFDLKEGNGVTSKTNQLGFIAQEVQSVFPDAVDVWGESDNPEKPYLSLGTSALIPVLVKAIQELKAELDATKAEVAELKATLP